jgi:hypothetical protein
MKKVLLALVVVTLAQVAKAEFGCSISQLSQQKNIVGMVRSGEIVFLSEDLQSFTKKGFKDLNFDVLSANDGRLAVMVTSSGESNGLILARVDMQSTSNILPPLYVIPGSKKQDSIIGISDMQNDLSIGCAQF